MKYRKTVEVEARQFTPQTDISELYTLAAWCGGEWLQGLGMTYIVVPTLQGDMRAWPGDWIVKGVQGEFYPVKPEVFDRSYERVEISS